VCRPVQRPFARICPNNDGAKRTNGASSQGTNKALSSPRPRTTRRLTPHDARQVPWDPSSFNFYKASPSEFLISYTPSFRHEREQAAATAEAAGGKDVVVPVEIDAAAEALAVPAAGEAKGGGALSALRGGGGGGGGGEVSAAAAAVLGGGPSAPQKKQN